MDSVGPDHQVERAGAPIGKPHLHLRLVLLQRLYLRTEAYRDAVFDPGIEQPFKIAAHEVKMPAAKEVLPEGCVAYGELLLTGSIHKGETRDLVVDTLELGHHAHLLARVVTRSVEVDHVALVAHLRRLLDDKRLVSVVVQPVCKRQTGDSSARDEHLHLVTSCCVTCVSPLRAPPPFVSFLGRKATRRKDSANFRRSSSVPFNG